MSERRHANVNGEPRTVAADVRSTLLDLLREDCT